MNEQNKKVPTVRFKGFTNDWEQRKGKSIFYSKSNKDFPELTVLSATQDKGMIPRSSTGIDIKYEKKSLRGYKKIEPGDFVVHLRSFQGGFAYSDLTGIVSPAYTVFTFKQPEMFNNYFWKEKFTSYNFIQLLKKVTYGVRDGRSISYSDFLTLNEKFPVKVEQTKIADLFKIIDNLIALQQRKLDLLKQLKKGLLQKMFADKDSKQPVLRFKGFHDDWEQRKLGDISKTKRGLTYKPSNIDNTGIRILRSSNIKEDTFVISDDDVFVKESAVNIPFVENGDILITAANGSTNLVGKHAIIRDIPKNSAVHGGFMLIITSKEYEFLNALMSSNWYKKFIKKYVAGGNGAIGNLRKNDLDNQKIYVPKKDEQEKIGNFFKMLDSLITLHQRKQNHLKLLKKSLLQQMFM